MGFGTRFICWLVPRVLVAVCCGCLHPYIPNFNLVLAGNFYSTFFYAYKKALICLLGCILGIKHQIMILLLEALYLSKLFPLWLVQGFVEFRSLAKRTSCLASEKEKMEISQKSQSPSSWIYIDSTTPFTIMLGARVENGREQSEKLPNHSYSCFFCRERNCREPKRERKRRTGKRNRYYKISETEHIDRERVDYDRETTNYDREYRHMLPLQTFSSTQ